MRAVFVPRPPAILATLAFLAPLAYSAPPADQQPQPLESEVPCARLAGQPLPQDAVAHRDPGNDTLMQLQASSLSSALEASPEYRRMRAKNDEAGIAFCFLEAYASQFKLDSPYKELRLAVTLPEDSGQASVRFKQYFGSLPVRDGHITVYLNPQKQVYKVEGRYYPTPSHIPLKPKPRLSAERATSVARDGLAVDLSAERSYRAEMGVYVGSGRRAALAYRISVSKGALDEWEIWIDANTGAVMERTVPLKPRL